MTMVMMMTILKELIEGFHGGHVGDIKQGSSLPWGNKVYFYANIFYCSVPPT